MDGLRPTAIITVDAVGLDMVSGVMATSAPLLLALRRAVTVARADPEAPRVGWVREDRLEAEADPVPEAQSQRRRASRLPDRRKLARQPLVQVVARAPETY